MSKIIDTKIKQKVLVKKPDISGFINDSDLNKKIETLTKKGKLKSRTRQKGKTENIQFKLFSW